MPYTDARTLLREAFALLTEWEAIYVMTISDELEDWKLRVDEFIERAAPFMKRDTDG